MTVKLRKFLIRMSKLSMYAMIICQSISLAIADNATAQRKMLSEIDINVALPASSSLTDLIAAIEEEGMFTFVYSKNKIGKTRITLDQSYGNMMELLNELSVQARVNIKRVNETIVLKEVGESVPVPFVEDKVLQQMSVTGTITDENGEGLPGATIQEKGTTNGTITDVEGSFSMNVQENAILTISFVGFKSKEVSLNGRSTLEVSLESDVAALEEVVVVGYGTQRKSDLTGTVASVNGDKLKETSAVSVAGALVGKAAGIQIQEINGRPGGNDIMVRVRGASSITAGNDPLYVIDGYPMDQAGLNMLNPTDIESIEVLKDASASAIYGSRGGNGVVLITTKRGNESEGSRVELSINTGIQEVANRPEMMNSSEYAEWFIDGHNNAWIQADPVNNKITDPNSVRQESYYIIPDEMNTPEVLPDTDWGSLIFRKALTQNYQLNVSNNSDKGYYNIGGSYVNQEGIVIETDFEKFNLHSNFVANVSDRVKVGLNLDGTFTKSNLIEEGKYGPVELSLVVPPVYPAYNPDGTYGSPVSSTWFKGDDPSPLEGAKEIDWKEQGYRTFGKLFAEFKILEGLKYNISVGGILSGRTEDQYRPSYIGRDSNPPPNQADARQWSSSSFNWLVENMLNYEKDFEGRHNLKALVGYTVQKNRDDNSYMYATNFPNDAIHTINAGQVTDGYTNISEHSLISYIARVNYSLFDKYLLTATVRADGSSRFGANNKWGTFPSASLGWRLSDEEFMKSINFVSQTKLRVSYGLTGNYNIPNYGSIGLLDNAYYVFGSGSGSLNGVVYPSTIPNPDLSWEKTKMFNIGLDAGLFENRIYFEIDYYNSITKDLLLDVPVPRITGFGSQLQNIGKVQNRGLEFTLTTRNLVGDFGWTTDFNISRNVNEVLALGPEDKPIFASAPNASNSFITEVGSPISNLYGYIFDGVYLTQNQIDTQPHLPSDVPGDPIIRDVNGDGEITSDDRAVLGNNQPDFILGLNNKFTYKNFDLSVLINGSYGAEVLRLSSRFTDFYHGDRNGNKEAVNRWRSPEQPGGGEYFRANRLYNGRQKEPSTYWVENGSFTRIRNVILGYTFNNSVLEKLKLGSARLYFSVTNLMTFTDYWGFDPEASTTGTDLSKGGDYSAYPLSRTYMFGVKVGF